MSYRHLFYYRRPVHHHDLRLLISRPSLQSLHTCLIILNTSLHLPCPRLCLSFHAAFLLSVRCPSIVCHASSESRLSFAPMPCLSFVAARLSRTRMFSCSFCLCRSPRRRLHFNYIRRPLDFSPHRSRRFGTHVAPVPIRFVFVPPKLPLDSRSFGCFTTYPSSLAFVSRILGSSLAPLPGNRGQHPARALVYVRRQLVVYPRRAPRLGFI